jgi:hypothetical protein
MHHTTRTTSAAVTAIGVDIGKNVFPLVGFDHQGQVAFRRTIKRLSPVETFRIFPPASSGWRRA